MKILSTLLVFFLAINFLKAECVLKTGHYSSEQINQLVANKTEIIIPNNNHVKLDGHWDLTGLDEKLVVRLAGNATITFSGKGHDAEAISLLTTQYLIIESSSNHMALNLQGGLYEARFHWGNLDYSGNEFDAIMINGGLVNKQNPVEFGSIITKENNDQIMLMWETKHENNNSHFLIMLSNDATTYKPISKEKAIGESYQSNYYSYQYTPQKEGKIYLKIRQIYNNGEYQDSEIIVTNFHTNTE
jgi:hypothetical protein